MTDRVYRAYRYLVGYCNKHETCETCRFADENEKCTLCGNIPADWGAPKPPDLVRLIGFERGGNT